ETPSSPSTSMPATSTTSTVPTLPSIMLTVLRRRRSSPCRRLCATCCSRSISLPAKRWINQASSRMTTMRETRTMSVRASSSRLPKNLRKLSSSRLVQAEGGFDIPHHRHQARSDVVLELALLHHEGGYGAVEGDDLAVHRAPHRHADGEHLALELAEGSAEA